MSGFKIYGWVTEDGALVAGAGESTAEAVGHLVEILGDHLEDEIQATVVDLVNRVSRLVEDTDPPPLDDGGSADPLPPTGGDGGPAEQRDTEDSPEAPDEPGADLGAGDDQDVVEGAQEGRSCVVCGADVPAGWAEVSLEETGQVACMKHSA